MLIKGEMAYEGRLGILDWAFKMETSNPSSSVNQDGCTHLT